VAVAGLVAGGALLAKWRGGAAGTLEREVRPQFGCSGGCRSGGGGGLFIAPILPNFVAPLDKGLRLLELLRVGQVSDVAGQFCGGKGPSGSPSLWPAAGQ